MLKVPKAKRGDWACNLLMIDGSGRVFPASEVRPSINILALLSPKICKPFIVAAYDVDFGSLGSWYMTAYLSPARNLYLKALVSVMGAPS